MDTLPTVVQESCVRGATVPNEVADERMQQAVGPPQCDSAATRILVLTGSDISSEIKEALTESGAEVSVLQFTGAVAATSHDGCEHHVWDRVMSVMPRIQTLIVNGTTKTFTDTHRSVEKPGLLWKERGRWQTQGRIPLRDMVLDKSSGGCGNAVNGNEQCSAVEPEVPDLTLVVG